MAHATRGRPAPVWWVVNVPVFFRSLIQIDIIMYLPCNVNRFCVVYTVQSWWFRVWHVSAILFCGAGCHKHPQYLMISPCELQLVAYAFGTLAEGWSWGTATITLNGQLTMHQLLLAFCLGRIATPPNKVWNAKLGARIYKNVLYFVGGLIAQHLIEVNPNMNLQLGMIDTTHLLKNLILIINKCAGNCTDIVFLS